MKRHEATGANVITANLLAEGWVVYLTPGGGWSEALGDAWVAHTDAEKERALDLAEAAVTGRKVVGPYAIPVAANNGTIHPIGTRETIRASRGPTITPPTGSFRPDAAVARPQARVPRADD